MLSFADLQFCVRFGASGRLGRFRGTTLRGALGYALKHTVCHVHHRDCGRCILRGRCAFPAVFEGVPPADRTFMRKYPTIPQPMVLRVGADDPREVSAEERYEFGIRLFGPAFDFYPYVVAAVLEMGQKGLGADRTPFAVERVHDGATCLYEGDNGMDIGAPRRREIRVEELGVRSWECGEEGISDFKEGGMVRLTMDILTPMRLRTEGRINRVPELSAILQNAVRRLRILSHFYGSAEMAPEKMGELIEAAQNATVIEHRTEWFELPRRSARQGVDMRLDGVTGRVVYELPDARMVPWLLAAQECHIGKATSFGFGRIACKVNVV